VAPLIETPRFAKKKKKKKKGRLVEGDRSRNYLWTGRVAQTVRVPT
jgi:hypothetical protein